MLRSVQKNQIIPAASLMIEHETLINNRPITKRTMSKDHLVVEKCISKVDPYIDLAKS
jgi:hypothetical protein